MRARIYDSREKAYYISEVYGILNCGVDRYLVEKRGDEQTLVLVDYMDFSFEPPYPVYVEKIDANPLPFPWVNKEKEEMEHINAAIGVSGKYHYFRGYAFIWEKKEVLAELTAKGCIAKERLCSHKIVTKLSGWNYVEKQQDIDNLMEQFCGFHDSVLKEFTYITGDYVAEDQNMHLSEAVAKQIRLVFESQWARGIEMILLAPRFIQLVPPAENYLADLYDASVFIKDCMVYFYDSYMEAMPATYQNSYFSAMGMRWRFVQSLNGTVRDVRYNEK